MRVLLFCLFVCTLGLVNAQVAQVAQIARVEYPEALQKAGVKRGRCLFKDSRGFIWIGTENGLYRFDGTNVDLLQHETDSTRSLPHNTISTITEDKQGFIWAGTMQGVALVDARTLGCVVYSKLHHNLDLDVDTKVLVGHDGRIWVGSSEGLSVLTGDRFKTVWRGDAATRTEDYFIHSMGEWKNDTLVLGTFDGAALYDTRSGKCRWLRPAQRGVTITRIGVDSRGRLWLGTWEHGCLVYDNDLRNYQTVLLDTPQPGRTVNIVKGLTMTQGGSRVWAATEIGLYTIGPDLTVSRVMDGGAAFIMADDEQYIWMGGHSVSRLFGGGADFSPFPTPVRGDVQVIQGFRFRGEPAVAFCSWYVPGGLTVTNPSGTRVLYRRPAQPTQADADVGGMAVDRYGRIWLSTMNGVRVMDSLFQPLRQGAPLFTGANTLVTTRTDRIMICHDTVWIAFYKRGLALYDLNFHLLRTYSRDDGSGMADDNYNMFFSDREGRVWIGGDNRLYRYDAANARFKAYNFHADGSAFFVNDMAGLPGGDLVVGSSTGVYRFDPVTETVMRIRSPLIADHDIGAVAVDKSGNVWFINHEHLVYYEVSSGHFTLFGNEDGMDIHDDLGNLRAVDGERFYLAGGDKITTFSRNISRKASPPISLYLHSIQVNDSSLPRMSSPATSNGPTAMGRPASLELNYRQDKITIEFGAINYIKPEQNQFAYRLTPVDHKWIYSNRNYASYANLAPGSYAFEVRAANYAGVWSDPISLAVVIRPPFWATWWFRLLSIVLIGAAAFFSIKYVAQRNLRERILRLQQEQAVEKERNRIARDMHDDLGSGLTKIAILSEVTKAQLAVPGAAVKNLDVISSASRELVDSLQDIVWVLNPRNDSFGSLSLYIREYAAGLFEPAGIVYSVECEAVERTIPLSEEKRRNIFLTVKESCNNILKYAHCSIVVIRMKVADNGVIIEIKDDGVGFDPGEVGPLSNGLRNMRNRMEHIGSRFLVISAPGKGTTVRLEVLV